MTLPYDTRQGYGVVVAQLATGTGDYICDHCRIPLKITKKELVVAKRHELPIMDQRCAEAYVLKGVK